jgi:tetratricopeptide (TPR) repeat protein
MQIVKSRGESGKGQPHSRTQARPFARRIIPTGLEVRLSSAALCIVAVMLVISSNAQAPADSVAREFDDANKLYEQSKFRETADAYERILAAGKRSPVLYFNLGNAWFKSGQMGRAISAYRQALKLAPRDAEIRANLGAALRQVQGPRWMESRLNRALGRLTLNEWALLAAAALWLWLAIMTLIQWRPALRPKLNRLSLCLAALTLLFCACAGLAIGIGGTTRLAAVVIPESTVHNGPLDESPMAFTARDGAELRILDQKDEWLQVSTDNKRIGWIKKGDVLLERST